MRYRSEIQCRIAYSFRMSMKKLQHFISIAPDSKYADEDSHRQISNVQSTWYEPCLITRSSSVSAQDSSGSIKTSSCRVVSAAMYTHSWPMCLPFTYYRDRPHHHMDSPYPSAWWLVYWCTGLLPVLFFAKRSIIERGTERTLTSRGWRRFNELPKRKRRLACTHSRGGIT